MHRLSELSLNFLGYNRKEVNQLVEHKDQQIKELEASNQMLDQRVNELEKKVDYYLTIESALKDGLLDARKSGNEIVAESKEQADKLLAKTTEQVIQYKESFAYGSKELANTGTHLKDQLKAMQQQMLAIIKDYESYIAETDFDAIYPNKQVTRFIEQVDYYELEDEFDFEAPVIPKQNQAEEQLSETEKVELQRLISEVIQNETNSLNKFDDKLVDFSQRKATK